ncbi:ring-h2 zinc finger protein [Lasius niger]|uniref:Ring-h2 zinc finger protein n=1 Tax=Lasius niger TaxID=67767 RepID=A0A0J7MMH5_LASNI|nr:ring-h2 zinc finger protein [Lasius niger]
MHGSEQECCSICLEPLMPAEDDHRSGESSYVTTVCSHNFHVRCLSRWYSNNDSCPICRAPTIPRIRQETFVLEAVEVVKELKRELFHLPVQTRNTMRTVIERKAMQHPWLRDVYLRE